jgi:NhaC family Na+:H+ antiporter
MDVKEPRNPSLLQALVPIAVLICLLVLNVTYFGDHTLDGANQVALILASAVAGIIAITLGVKWTHIRTSMVTSISSAMPSILILLMIGALAGTWLLSGVVPTLIYYGLKVFHPKIFLFATVIIAGMVSLATGSSWSTIATIGIALIGVGQALGISSGLIAGAVISGAYFGDKMSPLSDTTNLAPAMAGTDLFTHIRYMTITTVPAMSVTLVIFLVIGFTYKFDATPGDIELVLEAIDNKFNVSPWLMLVPAFLIFIIVKKIPPLPALLAGSLMGGIFALIFQPHLVRELALTLDGTTHAGNVEHHLADPFCHGIRRLHGVGRTAGQDHQFGDPLGSIDRFAGDHHHCHQHLLQHYGFGSVHCHRGAWKDVFGYLQEKGPET